MIQKIIEISIVLIMPMKLDAGSVKPACGGKLMRIIRWQKIDMR